MKGYGYRYIKQFGIGIGILGHFILGGCTQKSAQDLPSFASMSVPTVETLSLSRYHSDEGVPWSAKFQKSSKKTDSPWEILSGPSGEALLSKDADSNLIVHLLDTLKTLKVEKEVKEAKEIPLGAYGLDPPFWAIRVESNSSSREVRIGQELPKSPYRYVTFDGKKVYQAQGVLFRILEHIESFRLLRNLNWARFPSDDVFELRIRKRGNKSDVLYAQRDGDAWTDQKHNKLPQNIDFFLEKITALTGQDIIDSSEQVEKLVQESKKWRYEIDLIGRKGNLTTLRLSEINRQIYGFHLSEPKRVIVLSPQSLRIFESIL